MNSVANNPRVDTRGSRVEKSYAYAHANANMNVNANSNAKTLELQKEHTLVYIAGRTD
jgi:hypothetical protein